MDLRRKLVRLMLVKLAALVLLWACFFSPAGRPVIDAARMGAQLALGPHASPLTAPLPGEAHQ